MLDNWFAQAISPGGILTFLLGFLTASIYQVYLKPKWFKRCGRQLPYRVKFSLTNIIIVVGIFSVIWTGVRYTQLATSVALCQDQFNSALVANREVNEKERVLNISWQRATLARAQRLTDLQDKLGPSNPEYVQQKYSVDVLYFKTISSIEIERIKNEHKRQPYPEPSCGRKR